MAASRWGPHLRGHLFLFGRGAEPPLSPQAGTRLLLVAALLEILRLTLWRWIPPSIPLWLRLPGLLGVSLLAVPWIARVPLSQLGLRPWRTWSPTERSYFLQVLVIANVVFPLVLAGPIAKRLAAQGAASSLAGVFVPYLFFGFYQELVYRGMIQSALVRRWRQSVGILVANLLYTFGPLHAEYFGSRASLAIPMLAGIFAMGLFFGVLYHRARNLWMVGVFHAIGNAYVLWSVGPVR